MPASKKRGNLTIEESTVLRGGETRPRLRPARAGRLRRGAAAANRDSMMQNGAAGAPVPVPGALLLPDDVPAPFGYIGTDHRFRFVNKHFEDFFRLSTRQIVGKGIEEILGPRAHAAIGPRLETGNSGRAWQQQVPLPLDDKSGSYKVVEPRWVRMTFVPDRQRRRVRGFFLLLADISDLLRAEGEIESMARFPEEDPNPVFRVSHQGLILHANRASRSVLQAWSARVGQRLPRPWFRYVEAAIRTNQVLDEEVVLDDRIVSLAFTPIPETDYVNVYGRDVTARRLAEKALSENRERLRAILNGAADAIVTVDERGQIEGVNPAAERMFGYPRHEMIRRDARMLLPEWSREEQEAYFRQRLQSPEPFATPIDREMLGCRKDGSIFAIELAVSELRHGDHRLFIGIIRDVARRKELEREVAELPIAEQRRIGQELHDELGQELTGLGYLAASVHEDALAGTPADPAETEKLLANIERIVGRVRSIIQGLIPAEVATKGLVQALSEVVGNVQDRFGIDCRYERPRSALRLDPTTATQLYYITREAITNAVKHSQARHISLCLHQGPRQVTLEVRDDGMGCEPEGRSATGLGQRIMAHRAGLIGASLRIESVPGAGTAVTCALERKRANATRKDSPAHA